MPCSPPSSKHCTVSAHLNQTQRFNTYPSEWQQGSLSVGALSILTLLLQRAPWVLGSDGWGPPLPDAPVLPESVRTARCDFTLRLLSVLCCVSCVLSAHEKPGQQECTQEHTPHTLQRVTHGNVSRHITKRHLNNVHRYTPYPQTHTTPQGHLHAHTHPSTHHKVRISETATFSHHTQHNTHTHTHTHTHQERKHPHAQLCI
jgi:hypothetical protein